MNFKISFLKLLGAKPPNQSSKQFEDTSLELFLEMNYVGYVSHNFIVVQVANGPRAAAVLSPSISPQL